jgi:hypothetical protein
MPGQSTRHRRMLLAAAVSMIASAAHAQGMIPTVIGATIGNQTAAEGERAERECMAGNSLLGPEGEAAMLRKPKSLMETYLNAPATTDERTLKRLFFDRKSGGVWDRAIGLQTDGVLRNPLAPAPGEAAPSYTQESLLLAGDTWSARGVWKAERRSQDPQQPNERFTYVVDFTREKIWGRWGIWRIRIYGPSEAVEAPSHVCHRTQAAALW